MKRHLKRALGLVSVSVAVSGCAFNPADNNIDIEYGATPVEEESTFKPGKEIMTLDYGVAPSTDYPESSVEPSFNPEVDNDMPEVYGPAPDIDKSDDTDNKKVEPAPAPRPEFDNNIVTKYGPMPDRE